MKGRPGCGSLPFPRRGSSCHCRGAGKSLGNRTDWTRPRAPPRYDFLVSWLGTHLMGPFENSASPSSRMRHVDCIQEWVAEVRDRKRFATFHVAFTLPSLHSREVFVKNSWRGADQAGRLDFPAANSSFPRLPTGLVTKAAVCGGCLATQDDLSRPP